MPRKLNVKVPRLGRNRLGVFFVRLPSFLDEGGKRKVVQQSLRTKDPFTAKLRALKINLDLALSGEAVASSDPKNGVVPWTVGAGGFSAEDADDHARMMHFLSEHKDLVSQFIKGRSEAKPAPTPLALAPTAGIDTEGAAKTGWPLETLFNKHLVKEALKLKPGTIEEKRVLFREFMDVFGAQTGINAIRAEDITMTWTEIEAKRPNKKYPGETLGLARLEKRRGYLLKFFSWAIRGKVYAHSNPMAEQIASKAQIRARSKSWAEFNTGDLTAIFSDSYPKIMDKPDWYWVPLIGLFSGARLSEVCDLSIKDFFEIEGIKVFEIQDGKSASSRRIVPAHSKLLNLGLWEYVESLRHAGATHFIPHRPTKTRSKSTGLRFGDLIDQSGIQDRRKVFHSFRSTAITDMHNSPAGAAAIRKVVGHASGEVEGVHGSYIRGLLLIKLTEAVEQLKFDTINFDGIKLSDPTFSEFFKQDEEMKKSPSYQRGVERKKMHSAAHAKRRRGLPLAG